MKIKNIVIYGIASAVLLSGCSVSKDVAKTNLKYSYEINNELLFGNYQEGDTKIFEPFSHYISIKLRNEETLYGDATVINNIPDGYQIYSIFSSDDKCYHVWFVNTKEVKCTATYNAWHIGFYNFGEVIENTKKMN